MQQQQRNAFPGSLSDLVASFENVKQKGEQVPKLIRKACDLTVCVIILVLAGDGNSGTSDDKFGPGAQVAGRRILEHAAAAGY